MKEHPILFSAPMVRRILDKVDPKTQTRRGITRRNSTVDGYPSAKFWNALDFARAWTDCGFPNASGAHDFGYLHVPRPLDGDETVHRARCRIEPGHRLWVRETWYCDDHRAQGQGIHLADNGTATRAEFLSDMHYRADHDCRSWEAGCPCSDDQGRGAWRPSIFMPRWASRISLEITSVRAERLHQISEADAKAEGAPLAFNQGPRSDPDRDTSHRAGFEKLWREINGSESWNANLWVWVIGFNRVPA